MDTQLAHRDAGALTPDGFRFDALVDKVAYTLPSPGSKRAYAHDLKAWRGWADEHGHDATMPYLETVGAYVEYLAGEGKGRATIQRRVSAIRRLRKEVLKGNVASRLLLDFSDVAFISSKVLGQVITLDKVVKASGGRLKLCNVRPEIYELFRLTRLDRVFEIAEA